MSTWWVFDEIPIVPIPILARTKERREKRGIPSKILVMDSTEDKSQEKTVAENKKLQRINQGLIQLKQKNQRKQ